MEYEQQFSNLIYEYLLKRLQFGYYVCGDSLPTVEVLCRQFNVSDHTIWAAMRRLRSEGYISMKKGQATKVIYNQTEQVRLDNVINYFSERWESYYDLYEATELLYVPLMIEGLRRMDEQEKGYIIHLAKRANADDITLFYCYTLQKIENPLLLNLFWETSLFLGFPFVKPSSYLFQYDAMVGQEQFKALLILIKNNAWDSVQETLIQYQRSYIGCMIEKMEPLIREIPKEEQISFVWRIYYDRPQICYNLATILLHEIYMGEYIKTKYLPSYEKMAQKYDVSVSTMRRTIRMLNEIGAVHTVNGKGTLVFTVGKQCKNPDFSSVLVRRNLSYCIQSFALLYYTGEEVTRRFIASLSIDEREELIKGFDKLNHTGFYEVSIWHYLLFITKHSRIQAIREIYGIIYGLFLWAYPLKASLDATPITDKKGAEFTVAMIQGLKERNTDHCAATVKAYIQEQLPVGKEYLMQKGIKEEELRIFPSIRLLLIND